MRIPVITALAAFAVLTIALPVAAQSVLDQSFTAPTNLGSAINECCAFVGQTYTAGATGTLTGVSIDVTPYGSYPLHVAIRTVVDDLPTTTVLADATLSSGGANLSELIVFEPPITQVAGVKYAIVVNYPDAPPPGAGLAAGIWNGATDDVYPGGDMVHSLDEGVSWIRFGPNNFDLHFQTYVSPPVLGVAIDIKPGSATNAINPGSQGTIPVAILSSSTFSAPESVSRRSLTFGRTGGEASLAFCNATGEDVNGDGIADLVCHFKSQQTGFRPGDTAGVLRGRTVKRTSLCGTDSIKVVPAE